MESRVHPCPCAPLRTCPPSEFEVVELSNSGHCLDGPQFPQLATQGLSSSRRPLSQQLLAMPDRAAGEGLW